MKGHKGFTLIELLIVVAIIAILAAIAIPNFLAAQTRSKVSRAKAESQSLATALESYYIDNNVYPRADQPVNLGPAESYDGAGTYAADGGCIPAALTTPVAFITSLFKDPFKKNGKGFYEYGGGPTQGTGIAQTWPSGGWIVTSYGPDNVDGYTTNLLKEETAWSDSVFGLVVPLIASPYTYDPTNGTTSGGDVWRRGP
jgi:prepilin-type N-terminal cleavage/methylation domain-containing protein